MIRQVQLQTRSGVYLCNLDNVSTVTKMIWKPETKLGDFLAMDNHDDGSGAGGLLQKCNSPNQISFEGDASAFTAAFYTEPATLNALAVANRAFIKRPNVNGRRHDDASILTCGGVFSGVNVAYNEAKYLSGGGSNTATPVINVKIPLSMIYNTIFALDKTIMFPEILTMRIVWHATSRTSYYVDGAATINTADSASAPTALNATISNLNLFLAVKTNPEVIQEIQQKVASPEGMDFMIDYPYVYKNTLAGGTQNATLSSTEDMAKGSVRSITLHLTMQKLQTLLTIMITEQMLKSLLSTQPLTAVGSRSLM